MSSYRIDQIRASAYRIPPDQHRQFMLSGNLASMAPGLPYTIAAQLAYPDRQCIAFVGDGGFAMLMAEFLTAARYGLPIKVFICNNGVLGQILWEQMALGFPEFAVRWEQHARFAPWAEACRDRGARVPRPRAGGRRGDPDEPPMPASITYEQAKGFASSFLHGQPRRASIVSTLFRDGLRQFRAGS